MKTPEEIKKGMTCCLTRWEGDYLASCHTDCPYRSEGIWCRNVLMADIKAWNKQLESRLAQVERERDALMGEAKDVGCALCRYVTSPMEYIRSECFDCVANCNFEWRGVCAENTKEE